MKQTETTSKMRTLSPLCGKTVQELCGMLASGEATSVAITQAYIDSAQRQNPHIGAYIAIEAEEALREAAASDARRAAGQPLSSLDGIPIAVKDNIVREGHVCSCASRMLADFVSPYDATAIQKIKAAGMPILGRLNMDEFAMGGSTETSAFGPCRNPWDTTRVPGGSSGGSAAAVAAGMAPVALGSDTGGSIRQPASFCGVVGVKPAYGTVSRYGLVAFASSLDQIGVLAKTAADAALVMNIIAGEDARDMTSDGSLTVDFVGEVEAYAGRCPGTPLGAGQKKPFLASFHEAKGKDKNSPATKATLQGQTEEAKLPLQGIVLGMPRECYADSVRTKGDVAGMPVFKEPAKATSSGLHSDVRHAMEVAADHWRALGAEVRKVSLPMLPYALPAYYVVSSAEASSNLARYDGVRYGYRTPDYASLDEMYKKTRQEAFGLEVKRRILLGTFALSSGYQEAYYGAAQEVRTLLTREIEGVLAGCHALLMPVAPTPAYCLGEKKDPMDMYIGDLYTVPANITGLPALSVPCGLSAEGLPIGMGLLGARDGLARLLGMAAVYEQEYPVALGQRPYERVASRRASHGWMPDGQQPDTSATPQDASSKPHSSTNATTCKGGRQA